MRQHAVLETKLTVMSLFYWVKGSLTVAMLVSACAATCRVRDEANSNTEKVQRNTTSIGIDK